ncbi:uncharacterized protein TrAFT101_000927 [Trichoderma asperellum]|uniref:uncharacterized protein n=1 Tax=Trichoderma asperellum TaxID=101201 RepID=UPI00331AA17A|nr:hypothetical protein TrAFT101_000927 [Trichoderma asperellum]
MRFSDDVGVNVGVGVDERRNTGTSQRNAIAMNERRTRKEKQSGPGIDWSPWEDLCRTRWKGMKQERRRIIVDVNPGLCDHAPWFDWRPGHPVPGYYATPGWNLAEAEYAERLLAGAGDGDAVRNLVTAATEVGSLSRSCLDVKI